MSSRGLYDNTGAAYNVTRILDGSTTFDRSAYKQYSPAFVSMTFAVSYGLSFGAISALIVHTILYFRRHIWLQTKRSLREQPDIHARLMMSYRQVPTWWYIIIFIISVVFGLVANEVWHTELTVWGFFLALLVGFLYTVPVGMIQATTNQQVALNVVTELIVGYVLPGRPISMMLFKTWGYIGLSQALKFVSDMKLGHYMKIPPRSMFAAQIIGTVVTATTQLAVQFWLFRHVPGMCQPGQKDGFICANTETFAAASVIWGVIGPSNQFSKGQTYFALNLFFAIGAIVPLIVWGMIKKWPNSRLLRYVNTPLIFGGTYIIPPASAVNFVRCFATRSQERLIILSGSVGHRRVHFPICDSTTKSELVDEVQLCTVSCDGRRSRYQCHRHLLLLAISE